MSEFSLQLPVQTSFTALNTYGAKRNIQRETSICLHKLSIIFFNFNQNWNVLTNFNKTPQYQMS